MSKYRLEGNALKAKGEVYRHYKGGIYRKLFEATNTETGELDVVYEHLWPHQHGYFTRPKSEFEDTVIINGNKLKRFSRVVHIVTTEDEYWQNKSQSD